MQRTLDTTGNILEKTLDSTGKVLSSRTVGSLTNLKTLTETTNAAGQTVRRLQDTSGGVIEVTLDTAGKIINSKVLSQGSALGSSI